MLLDTSYGNLCLITYVKHVFMLVATNSDDGQQRPKHAEANFYILILNFLH
jgi:hypothetical protein